MYLLRLDLPGIHKRSRPNLTPSCQLFASGNHYRSQADLFFESWRDRSGFKRHDFYRIVFSYLKSDWRFDKPFSWKSKPIIIRGADKALHFVFPETFTKLTYVNRRPLATIYFVKCKGLTPSSWVDLVLERPTLLYMESSRSALVRVIECLFSSQGNKPSTMSMSMDFSGFRGA